MTLAQNSRLHSIAVELAPVKHHPSEWMKDKFKDVEQETIDAAVKAIKEIIKKDDGKMAYRVISAWHTGLRNVIKELNNYQTA